MERDLLVCQLSINSSISIGAALNIGLITPIKVNLENTTSINLAAGALSGDFSGVHDILQDGILDRGEGTGAGTQSLGLLGASITLSKDVTLGNDDKVLSREFLFQLADETSLDLLEGLLEFVGDINNSGLASASTVDLLGGDDEKITK